MADPAIQTNTIIYSHAMAVKKTIDIPFPVAANFAWDSLWRGVYNNAAEGIAEQAQALLERGNVTLEEARQVGGGTARWAGARAAKTAFTVWQVVLGSAQAGH